jgi:hypothetical protein
MVERRRLNVTSHVHYNTCLAVICTVEVISEKLQNCEQHTKSGSQRIRRAYSAYRGKVCSGAGVLLKKSKLMMWSRLLFIPTILEQISEIL